MHHDVVEPAGGQDGMHPDHWFGHEADEVAGLGATGFDSLRDGFGDDLRIAEHVAAVLLAHSLGGLGGLSLVGSALGRLLQMVGSDETPFGFDAARLDDGYINTEIANLHAQGIAESLYGMLRGMIPGTEVGGQSSANRRHVDDGAAVLLAHIGQHLLREDGKTEDVHLELTTCLVDAHILDGSV